MAVVTRLHAARQRELACLAHSALPRVMLQIGVLRRRVEAARKAVATASSATRIMIPFGRLRKNYEAAKAAQNNQRITILWPLPAVRAARPLIIRWPLPAIRNARPLMLRFPQEIVEHYRQRMQHHIARNTNLTYQLSDQRPNHNMPKVKATRKTKARGAAKKKGKSWTIL